MDAQRLIFHVDINAFFAAVEQQRNPRLRGKPIAVCGNPKTRTVVAACSYEAKAFGIGNGMSVDEARRLCPQLILVPGHPDVYVGISRRFFGILEGFTPQVEVFSIDEAFIDMTGSLIHFSVSPEGAARQMKAAVKGTLGLLCSIGIGPNKLIAKLASDMRKPDGLLRIRSAEIPSLFARLPIEALCGIGPALKRQLNEMNVFTCAELGAFSEAGLVRRFGVLGATLKRMGQGIDASAVRYYGEKDAALSVGHDYTLPFDTGDAGVIRETLLKLADKVAVRLRRKGARAGEVQLTVRYSGFRTVTRHRSLACATDSGLVLYEQAWLLFERHCRPLFARVRLLGVRAARLIYGQRQLTFLSGEERLNAVERAMDRLNERFGDDAVCRASCLYPLTEKSHGFIHHSL